MTRPLSNDLRERVVAAVTGGESCRSIALRFNVAVSSVVKWSQRHRATGSVAPGKMGGHRKSVLDAHRAFIVERIAQTPLPIPTKAPVCNGIMPPGDSGIMAPSCNGMIPPGRRVS